MSRQQCFSILKPCFQYMSVSCPYNPHMVVCTYHDMVLSVQDMLACLYKMRQAFVRTMVRRMSRQDITCACLYDHQPVVRTSTMDEIIEWMRLSNG